MNPFLDALCDKDISQIIISGNPRPKELDEAWVKILIEYYELRGDNANSVETIRLQRDITRTKSHLHILNISVEHLKKYWSDSIADSVRRMGYDFSPVSHVPEEYTIDLDMVVQQSKTKYIQLQQFIKQLAAEMKKLEGVIPKREGFERNLLEFEEMQRTAYSFDMLTVSKYVNLEKKYNRLVERLNARNAK